MIAHPVGYHEFKMELHEVEVAALGRAPAPRGAGRMTSLEGVCPPAVVVARAEDLAEAAVPDGVVVVALGMKQSSPPHVIAAPETIHGPALESATELARSLALELWLRARSEESLDRMAELEHELLEIGALLTAEQDLNVLLARILTGARHLVSADAGSLYLTESSPAGPLHLRFILAQNQSRSAPWKESVIPVDHSSMAGMAALTGEPVVVEDAYELPVDSPFELNKAFDEASGYRSRSVLAVPMTTRGGETVGVIQVINRKRRRDVLLHSHEDVAQHVVPFTRQDLDLLRSLAAQAAVVLENSLLVEEIRGLFDSFVAASVTAIEQRDPPTSGHSFRVAERTLALAEAVSEATEGPYRNVTFSQEAMRQLRYAALLHDVGKVGIREAVLTKERKLYPYQELLVRERFQHATRAAQLEAALDAIQRAEKGPVEHDELKSLNHEMLRIRSETKEFLNTVEHANEPTPSSAEAVPLLEVIARKTFLDPDNQRRPLLESTELGLLQIKRGNLDPAERREIQAHAEHSYRFLMTLPWPRGLERVPELAALHHEKLDGSGYPTGLSGTEIPLEVRILTICDIYDALTAGDRPYKPRLTPERAVEILREEALQGALDSALVELFIGAGIHLRATTTPEGSDSSLT